MENHFVQVSASGVLTDGRTIDFHVTHVGDQTKNITCHLNNTSYSYSKL